LVVVLATGGASVWIRVAQPHSGGHARQADKDIVVKGSSIGENAPPPDEDPPAST
jgi:hypothetical protein